MFLETGKLYKKHVNFQKLRTVRNMKPFIEMQKHNQETHNFMQEIEKKKFL